MIRIFVATAVLAVGFSDADTPANAAKDGDKCHHAWEDRNAVYKAKNYCFRTARVKNWFGPSSSNCKRKVRLTASERREVNDAKRRERKQC